MNNKKVLIIRLSAMGDVIFTIPLANALKSDGYEVSWLVGDKGIDLIKNNPAVDETIYISEKENKRRNIFQKLIFYIKTINYIRSKNFDIAIDTQGLLKTFIWTRFCGAKRRIVSKSAREGAVLGGNEIIEKLYTGWDTHVTSDYLKFAKHIGIAVTEPKITLPSPEEETVKKIDKLLKNIDRTQPVIVISPATTWANKHWDKDNWKLLIERIKDKYTIIYTGTNDDKDLISYISQGAGLNLAGKTNVAELCELFRRTDLVISLDSGSTHLAWGTQIPKIISIFCCTPKTRYAPIDYTSSANNCKYIALSGNLPCQPCHKKKCSLGTNACTRHPSVEDVLNAIGKLMD